jgi:hypothetical protein
MKDDRLLNRLVLGGVIGAAFGVAVAWILMSRPRPDSQDARSGKPAKRANLGEILGLGLAVIKVIRQASELLRKV